MWIGSSSGLGDMDVDCDGANNSAGDCANDPSGQSETAFKDTVAQYGISDLNANVHGYVVLGNTAFDPQSKGIDPLSVVAVVCNNQLVCHFLGLMKRKTDVGVM
jgi:chitosanase